MRALGLHAQSRGRGCRSPAIAAGADDQIFSEMLAARDQLRERKTRGRRASSDHKATAGGKFQPVCAMAYMPPLTAHRGSLARAQMPLSPRGLLPNACVTFGTIILLGRRIAIRPRFSAVAGTSRPKRGDPSHVRPIRSLSDRGGATPGDDRLLDNYQYSGRQGFRSGRIAASTRGPSAKETSMDKPKREVRHP